MALYAKVVDGLVTQVIVADASFFTSFVDPSPGQWIETFTDGTRKNYAGIGYTYDQNRDAFIPPKVFASWILNEETCLWDPPVPYPNDGNEYCWDEDYQTWVQL